MRAGRIWVGTSDAGIDILDPATGRFEHLRHDAAARQSLGSDRILTLTLDRSGDALGGHRQRPRSLAAATTQAFAHFRPAAARLAERQRISRVLEDRSGALWVGTFDGGLNRMDRDGRVVQSFRHDPRRADSLANDDVRALLEDQAGHLWVGTADGLDLLDRATGQFSHYRHDAADAESLRDSFIMSLYQDQTGLVWIGTRAGGVSRWNPRSWELGGHRPEWLRDQPVTAFADAPDNKVWIGTLGGGLTLFDADTRRGDADRRADGGRPTPSAMRA